MPESKKKEQQQTGSFRAIQELDGLKVRIAGYIVPIDTNEKGELTSGSTWHAAGLLPLFNMSYATTHIHKYSVDFYKGLEAETGLNPGFYVVGNLRMAQTATGGWSIATLDSAKDVGRFSSLLLDPNRQPMAPWPVKGLPTTFLVDRQGRLALKAIGGREFDDPLIVNLIKGLL